MAIVRIIQGGISSRAIVHRSCIVGQILIMRIGIPAGRLIIEIIVECVDVHVAHVGQDCNVCA